MQVHCHGNAFALPWVGYQGLQMAKLHEIQSTLTDRYQTTVPESVRRALRLDKRDRIHYFIRSNGEVVLTRAEPVPEHDPVLEQFLSFLAADIAKRPDQLVPVDAAWAARMQTLVGTTEVDLTERLSDSDE
jgi:antitoxin PrlF